VLDQDNQLRGVLTTAIRLADFANFHKVSNLPEEKRPKAIGCMAENREGRATGPDEFTLKRKDGDTVIVETSTIPILIGEQQIVKIHPGRKAIIISGFAETDDVLEVQRLGAGQFLKKKVTLEKLGQAVKMEPEKQPS
jgi:DNA-binding NarL/FixJ family response regulator